MTLRYRSASKVHVDVYLDTGVHMLVPPVAVAMVTLLPLCRSGARGYCGEGHSHATLPACPLHLRCSRTATELWVGMATTRKLVVVDKSLNTFQALKHVRRGCWYHWCSSKHRRRKMFSLMGAGQNLPDAKAVCKQIKCPHRTNFMGAAAPIAPMVPIYAYGLNIKLFTVSFHQIQLLRWVY